MSSDAKVAVRALMNNAHVQRAINAIKNGSIQDIMPLQEIWIYEDGTLKVQTNKQKCIPLLGLSVNKLN